MPDPLFPAVAAGSGKEALRFGDRKLTYAELGAVAGALAAELPADRRVAVWATPTLHTSVAVVAALLAGVPVVPLNPKIGERELGHILADSEPALVLAEPGVDLPAALDLPRHDIPLAGDGKPCGQRAGRGSARVHRLHLGHDRSAQGRRTPPPRDRDHARRARGRLAVDGRRRTRPWPAVVPRPRLDPGHSRTAAPRRNCAPPGAVLPRRRHRGTRERRDDAVRRPDDVPPDRRSGRDRRSSHAARSSPRDCWFPARPRCRCTTTSGSPPRPDSRSWSATA